MITDLEQALGGKADLVWDQGSTGPVGNRRHRSPQKVRNGDAKTE